MRIAVELGGTDFDGALRAAAAKNSKNGMCLAVELGAKDFDGALRSAAAAGASAAMRMAKTMGATDLHAAAAVLRGKACRRLMQHWQAQAWQKEQHKRLLDAALALEPLKLPVYILLWMLEWVENEMPAEYKRVRLLEGVRQSSQKILSSRTIAPAH